MRPWGHLDDILPAFEGRRWTVITGVGFEPRCTEIIKYVKDSRLGIDSLFALQINDQDSVYTDIIREKTRSNEDRFISIYPETIVHRLSLFCRAEKLDSLAQQLCSAQECSVILDVSVLPKRIGLFLLQRILRERRVRDIILCYVVPQGYREGNIALNERTATSIDGFGLLAEETDDIGLFVSIGFSMFDVKQILQQSKLLDVRFLMPFPPASPSFRRTWRCLNVLVNSIPDVEIQVLRFHSLDMFEVYAWLKGHLDSEKTSIMLPLGPKPHSIAMALAQMENQTISKLVYPQPECYHPEYSYGVQKNIDGKSLIMGYGLKKEFANILDSVE